jgi:hypothetical protein
VQLAAYKAPVTDSRATNGAMALAILLLNRPQARTLTALHVFKAPPRRRQSFTLRLLAHAAHFDCELIKRFCPTTPHMFPESTAETGRSPTGAFGCAIQTAEDRDL